MKVLKIFLMLKAKEIFIDRIHYVGAIVGACVSIRLSEIYLLNRTTPFILELSLMILASIFGLIMAFTIKEALIPLAADLDIVKPVEFNFKEFVI